MGNIFGFYNNFPDDRVSQMIEIQKESLELFKNKNADYGDAFATHGIIGILIRIQDKINRALNITENNIELVNDEKIEDTLIDLHNYSAMALILIKEKEKDTETDNILPWSQVINSNH